MKMVQDFWADPSYAELMQAMQKRMLDYVIANRSHLHITLGAHRLVTLADPHTPPQPGQPVRITAARPLLFDAAGVRIAA